MDIVELQRRRAAGEVTAVELAQADLDRIGHLDPRLRAVLTVAPDALVRAAASDRRARDGALIGPLDGVTVLLKDNIDTADLPTRAGSRALAGSVPPRDADIVQRLRAAGAVVLGKANLSEWANFRSTNSVSGWSAVGGQTHNPHVLAHNPSGSSSGSAVAVAAGLARVAIGTETNGSIVSPAGVCGIVGVKPSLGLLSGAGIVPVSDRQDTAGPMARHVADVALTLAVLSGRVFPVHPVSLRGKRIGVWHLSGVDTFADRVIKSTVDSLTAAGAILVDVDLPDIAEIDERSWFALTTEFRWQIEAYLRTRPGAPHTLEALVEYNRSDPAELAPFGQELFELALDAAPPTDPGYLAHRAIATDLARRSVDGVLAEHRLDAIMAPTNAPAEVTGSPWVDVGSATPAAVSGYPAITVPAGFAGPLPVGVSFFTGAGRDAELITLAAAFEQVHPARQDPELHPTLPK
ncbi:amidase family protein [Actinokineospora sp.]|uniref:amidase family protein n=1 Tax=Actinokineospora sp. TaxID=1872133 RepID=UPI004037ED51